MWITANKTISSFYLVGYSSFTAFCTFMYFLPICFAEEFQGFAHENEFEYWVTSASDSTQHSKKLTQSMGIKSSMEKNHLSEFQSNIP